MFALEIVSRAKLQYNNFTYEVQYITVLPHESQSINAAREETWKRE
jgi:hypothetical protein